MTMTEEEAKKKWCPYARHEGDKGGSWNRTLATMKRVFGWDGSNPYPEETCNCIASACMAWRTHESVAFKERADREYAVSGDRLTPPGYCGLAGAP